MSKMLGKHRQDTIRGDGRRNQFQDTRSYTIRDSMDVDKREQEKGNMCTFTVLVLLVQGLGLTAVILVAVWMGHFRGGFAWQSDPDKEFNYHPVFMVIGMIFLYADATVMIVHRCITIAAGIFSFLSILAYRVFRNMKKLYIKILHGCIHLGALIFAAVGLKAVFDSHNLAANPKANLYSLHSWLGLITIIMFGLQWICGLVAFMLPVVGQIQKIAYMPLHIFWGVALLCMAGATALMGITEKAFAQFKDIQYDKTSNEAKVLNCLGLSIVALIVLVAYIVTRPEYRRQPSADEEHIQLMG